MADVDNRDLLQTAGRIGLVALGVMHVIIGWLALQLAFGDHSGSPSSSGAIQELAQKPLGGVLVWAVAVGFFLLAAWRAIDGFLGHRDEDGTERVRHLAVAFGKAVIYVVIGVSAVKIALSSGSSANSSASSSGGTDSMTAKVMDLPGGQVLVGAVGLGILAVGGALVWNAWTEKFLKKIDGEGRSGTPGTAYRWLGKAGYAAKGVSFGVIGALFVYAAIIHEPKKSGGLDQALLEILDQPFGPVLLAIVAVGIAAYGLFAFAQARHLAPDS